MDTEHSVEKFLGYGNSEDEFAKAKSVEEEASCKVEYHLSEGALIKVNSSL